MHFFKHSTMAITNMILLILGTCARVTVVCVCVCVCVCVSMSVTGLPATHLVYKSQMRYCMVPCGV